MFDEKWAGQMDHLDILCLLPEMIHLDCVLVDQVFQELILIPVHISPVTPHGLEGE